MFKDMRRNMGKDIYFKQGLPEFQLDLSDIDPCYNNIVHGNGHGQFHYSLNYSPKGDIETQESCCCYKMHFWKESTMPV